MQPILKLDLPTGKTEEYRIPEAWQREFLGGASLAARILYEHLTAELDPLAPEAPLLFLTGPLTGTSGPTTGRFVICGKSPATGLWAESNIGGFWGPELRAAGYDGLWITGKAAEPVYVWLNGSSSKDLGEPLEIRSAAHLWSMNTYHTQDKVREEVGVKAARVCVIGPAGEKQVLFASIMCDHGRMAGRTGMGAVMGAKNLKAVAVYGTDEIPVFDLPRYKTLRSEANRKLRDDNEAKVIREVGTAGAANYAEYLGALPVKYYTSGSFPSVDEVSGAKMTDTILVGRSACQGCVIACGRVVKLPREVAKRKGPEHETMVGFGANLLNANLESIVDLGDLCDRYGMDTISTSNTIGLAFQLYEKGIITQADTGGIDLQWGDVDAIEQLVRMTGAREGIGDLLAQGSRRFAAHFGVEESAVQVNGLEVAYHDPRGVSGMALSYATSPRGACHNQSDYFFVDWGHSHEELGIEFIPRHAQAEKAGNVARHQDWRSVDNALVMCIFANVPAQEKVNLINAGCGLNWSVSEMMKFGERSWNLKRAINTRMGLTRANDTLPKALLTPFSDGGSEGFVPDIEAMLSAYYQHRGWDDVTGKPTRDKLIDLGLDDIAQDLWR
jgi:aldehyde:ferredoxin oxidoreductase